MYMINAVSDMYASAALRLHLENVAVERLNERKDLNVEMGSPSKV